MINLGKNEFGLIVHKTEKETWSIDYLGSIERLNKIIDIVKEVVSSDCEIVKIDKDEYDLYNENILELQTFLSNILGR